MEFNKKINNQIVKMAAKRLRDISIIKQKLLTILVLKAYKVSSSSICVKTN
jgi:hypothetical protein